MIAVGGVVREQYRIEDVLHEGVEGLVLLASDITSIGKEKIALKCTRQEFKTEEAHYLKFFQESELVVNLIDEFTISHWHVLVMPYHRHNLLDYQINFHLSNRPDECKIIFQQICKAVKLLHDNHVAHLDIKAENILLDDGALSVKLSDFGLSVNAEHLFSSSSPRGSLFYCAPEMITCSQINPFKADIFSLGVLLYAMLTNQWPYMATSLEQLRKKIMCGKSVIFIDEHSLPTDRALIRLLHQMLTTKPEKRPTIDDVLSNTWVSGVQLPRKPSLLQKIKSSFLAS